MTPEQKGKKLLRVLDRIEKECSETRTITVRNPVAYGKKLREMREKSGVSLNTMAKKINRAPAFLSDCERGHRNLKQEDCMKFVAYCMAQPKPEFEDYLG